MQVKVETKSSKTPELAWFKIESAYKTSISVEGDIGWRFVLALWKETENPFLHSPYVSPPYSPANAKDGLS